MVIPYIIPQQQRSVQIHTRKEGRSNNNNKRGKIRLQQNAISKGISTYCHTTVSLACEDEPWRGLPEKKSHQRVRHGRGHIEVRVWPSSSDFLLARSPTHRAPQIYRERAQGVRKRERERERVEVPSETVHTQRLLQEGGHKLHTKYLSHSSTVELQYCSAVLLQ